MKILEILRKHYGAVLLSVIMGGVVVLPTILSIDKIGFSNFKGIYSLTSDDEDYYLTLTREVYDGHTNLSNPYIKEHKEGSYLFPPIPEITYSAIAKTLHISVATEAVVNDFFLPAISVLLLYVLFWQMTKSKKISLWLTSLFFLFFLSTFSRPVTPQFGFIFLLAGLNLIWLIGMRSHSLKNILIYNLGLAIVFSILVYSYPFYWMTLGTVYAVWTLLLAIFHKDFTYWVKNWASFFIPAFIFSLPFIFNTLALRYNPLFAETSIRFGFINTHFPGAFFNVALILLCVPVCYVLWQISKDKKQSLLAVSLIASGVILNWQNVITGQTLQFPPHFYPIIVLFIFLIAVISLSNLETQGPGKFSTKSKILLVILFLIFTFLLYKQKNEIIHAFKTIYSPADIRNLQKLNGPLVWLETNTPKDSALYVLGNFNWAIPIYTDDNIYFAASAGFSLMSDEELENRWAIQHFFDNISSADISGNRDIWSNKFIDIYQYKESQRKIKEFLTRKKYAPTVLMDKMFVERVLQKYNKFKTEGFEKALKTYKADYVILDSSDLRYKNLPEALKKYSFLVPAYKDGEIFIYKVN